MTAASCSPSKTTGPGVPPRSARGDLRAVPPGSDRVLALARHRHRAVARRPGSRELHGGRRGSETATAAAPPSRCSCRPDPSAPRHRPSRPRRPPRRDTAAAGSASASGSPSSLFIPAGAAPPPSAVVTRSRAPARTPPCIPRVAGEVALDHRVPLDVRGADAPARSPRTAGRGRRPTMPAMPRPAIAHPNASAGCSSIVRAVMRGLRM